MYDLSLLESNSQPFPINNLLSFYFSDCSKTNVDIFSSLTETKSYIPIAGCVLEHILTTTVLTNHEKLYYLLADGLAHINGKNITQGRVVSLASEDWAARLGCSRSLVFSMQKSLVKKGYFIINKDWNKIGLNKRNLITPTLPTEVFNHLNSKYPGKGGEGRNYSTTTECKRAYLDRTKLFVPLNYNLLKIITSSEELTQLQKVVWLDFYAKCYKSHISSDKQSAFSCITSYEELIERYGCSKASLSKLLSSLENNNFITKIRFFCKREHLLEDRQDKSLWQITLSMPTCYSLELMSIKDRTGLSIESDNLEEVGSNVSTLSMFHSQQESAPTLLKHQLYPKESYIEEVAEELADLDNISYTNDNKVVVNADGSSDGNPSVNVVGSDSGSSNVIGVNIADLTSKETSIIIEQQIKTLVTENCKNKIPYISGLTDNVACGDPQVSKSRLLLNKDLKLNIKDLDSDLYFSEFSKIVDKPGLKLSEFYKNSLEKKEKQWHGKGKSKRTTHEGVSPAPNGNKRLIDYYPLSNWQVNRLNNLSGREFCINFVNQLMMKMHNKSPKKVFVSKNHMMSYMSKVLHHEKHQAPMVNHETFRFAVNLEQSEIEEKVREKYLSELEYSLDTSHQSQLRRKIAGLFEPKLAYKLLTESKFECLNELFIIQLPSNLSLTERQQEFLENTVFSVYGNITINYEIVDNCFYTC